MKKHDWTRRACKDQEEQNSENVEPSVVVTNLGFFTEKENINNYKQTNQQTIVSSLLANWSAYWIGMVKNWNDVYYNQLKAPLKDLKIKYQQPRIFPWLSTVIAIQMK